MKGAGDEDDGRSDSKIENQKSKIAIALPGPPNEFIPMVENHLKDGRFQPTEDQKLDATRMLDALARWTGMLKERTD